MNPSDYVAVIGAAIGLVFNLVAIAYAVGAFSNRMKSMEEKLNELRTNLAESTKVRIDTMRDVESIKASVQHLMEDRRSQILAKKTDEIHA